MRRQTVARPSPRGGSQWRGWSVSRILGVSLGVTLIAGCASNGTLPAARVSEAERTISAARLQPSPDSALELKMAEDKLAEARAALSKQDYERARRLAEQAQVDADYARAKATSSTATKTADEMRQNVETLRRELSRMPQ